MAQKQNSGVLPSRSAASARARSSHHTATSGTHPATAPSQIWKSRLSWRITLAVFLTILTVQVAIMGVTVRNYKQERLDELTESARSSILPLIESRVTNFLTSPISTQQAHQLMAATRITGLAIYSRSDLSLLGQFGTPLVISLRDTQNIPSSYLSSDGSFYEVVLRPHETGRPYFIVTQIDSAGVKSKVQNYVEQTILVMLLMSAFVTTVLMIALGHWLLEPILFLRGNLQRATEDPENPKLAPSHYDSTDEIGGAIELASSLIHQNAENIRRIKSAAEDQIHKLAYYDTLTSLPNRTLFLQTLNEQIRKNTTGQFVVITIDLDHFKDINDSMGHNVGDAILRSVGKRLRASLPESATVARSGEDEFAITMPLASGTVSARDVADLVIGVIRAEPFKIFNENFQVRVSIGVATYPRDGADPDQVLKNADIALNRAKEEGRDTIKEYSEDFDRAVQQRFQILRDLRNAMENNELSLHFQPQIDLRTGRVIGAEALIRWWQPDNSKAGGRFISPIDFIPLAEQSGLIVPIGEKVLRQACEAAAEWTKAGHNIRVAVNVSGAQFYQSDIVATVSKALRDTGLPATLLEMEVTESVFMEDVQHAIQTLQNLHAMGVELAIDDFGTGYSSLSYLRQFPIDRLKIDQSFIRNALNNLDDAAIARTIVKLGHSLNLKVIAEGVESKEHEDFLRAEDCDEVQGYRYSKPIPLDKFNDFIATYKGDMQVFNY